MHSGAAASAVQTQALGILSTESIDFFFIFSNFPLPHRSCGLIITLQREGGTTFKVKHTLTCSDSVPPTQGNTSYLKETLTMDLFKLWHRACRFLGKIKLVIYLKNTISLMITLVITLFCQLFDRMTN